MLEVFAEIPSRAQKPEDPKQITIFHNKLSGIGSLSVPHSPLHLQLKVNKMKSSDLTDTNCNQNPRRFLELSPQDKIIRKNSPILKSPSFSIKLERSPCKSVHETEMGEQASQDNVIFQKSKQVRLEYDCPICYCSYEENETLVIMACHHRFCRECLDAYLRSQIDQFNVLQIKCPKDQCGQMINESDVQLILDKETFHIYQNRKLMKLRNKDVKLRYCPKPGCTKPFYPQSEHNTTTCACGTIICNSCFNPVHKGKTCSEVAPLDLTIYLEGNNLKKCFICKTIIEKHIGCSHITCPVCDYEWCWDCGREWEPGHVTTCLYVWSPKPPKALQNKGSLNCLDECLNSIFLLFEILTFGLISALTVAFIWPCLMREEFRMLVKKRVKSKSSRHFLSVVLALLSWPIAVVIYPFYAIFEEYGVSWKRRRWVKGKPKTFRFHNKFIKRFQKKPMSRNDEERIQQDKNHNESSRIEEGNGRNIEENEIAIDIGRPQSNINLHSK